jgi:hypothetical protein
MIFMVHPPDHDRFTYGPTKIADANPKVREQPAQTRKKSLKTPEPNRFDNACFVSLRQGRERENAHSLLESLAFGGTSPRLTSVSEPLTPVVTKLTWSQINLKKKR